MDFHEKYLKCQAETEMDFVENDIICTVKGKQYSTCEGCPYEIPFEVYLEELSKEGE